MAAPVLSRERDLRALAGIVSEDREDIPARGVPLSLLAEIAGQIRCDVISFEGFDSAGEVTWFLQAIRGHDEISYDGPDDDPFDRCTGCITGTASQVATRTGPVICARWS